ncbi:MAG TPA: protein kinase, partial [Dongiaceae bacterium]|nr:protein kinase [Dongiaceae bacterium]
EIERMIDAISEGTPVAWPSEIAGPGADPETLEALRLIEEVARVHRRGTPGPTPGADEDGARTWGNLLLRQRIGAGAHGEVYRAFDPGLRREVALKLWNPTLRPRLIEELLHEARALARVRHPNVLLVHGADVREGQVGMWTELLEGATLDHLLERFGPCTWREAALVGIDLCRALTAVHAAGVLHRDVKGSNVMRERGGRVVLMDFGSAGLVDEAADADDAVGTPLATAPEVLRGEPATPASDLYGVGVALFRQITGRYPVEAGSLAELRERHASTPVPSLRALCPDVPDAFARVIDCALSPDPAHRPSSAVDMERMLADALSSDWAHTAVAPRRSSPPSRARRAVLWAAAAGLTLVVAAVAWRRHAAEPAGPPPIQFILQLPAGEHLWQYGNVVVSPDGEYVAFASLDTLGHRNLWVRRFDALESTRLPGTDGASLPFWSPDGRDIGFFSGGELKRVGVMGGPVRIVCPAPFGRGGSWSRHGTILFASSTQGPLERVPAAGGSPIQATVLDSANAEVSHRWPCFLPDGEHFLYVKSPATNGTYSLFVGSINSDRRAYIGEVESGAAYSSGVLVYVRNRMLEARPFDLHTLRWSGDPMPISSVPGIGGALAEPHASVSQNGILVYPFSGRRQNRLTWYDTRTGITTAFATGPYFDPAISPDGRHVAAERTEATGHSEIWMVDGGTGAAERWTDGGGLARYPQWSPSGDSLVFSSNRSGRYALYVRATHGPLADRLVLEPEGALLLWPMQWLAGGRILFDSYTPGTGYDVFELAGGKAVPLARTKTNESHGALSPDGHWLAFESDATGRVRIHLLDMRTGERYMLSGELGEEPRWASAAGRLFFHDPAGRFYEVSPVTGRTPDLWPTRALFRTGLLSGYDVDPAGRRLLCSAQGETDRPDEIGVIANLRAAVRRGP